MQPQKHMGVGWERISWVLALHLSSLNCAIIGKETNAVSEQQRSTFRLEDTMDSLWLALFWTGPIGVGVFLAGLGVLFWGIAQFRKESGNGRH